MRWLRSLSSHMFVSLRGGRFTVRSQSAIPALLVCLTISSSAAADEPSTVPRCVDPRLTIEQFAAEPMVVTPTGIAVDHESRVFVAESHTHFRPDSYDGPETDRILVLEDTDGDGKADKRTIFHEGFTHVMDIEFHHDGSLYVATRMDIHRMRDTDGDLVADEITPIVTMRTTGTYPHNGLSGLAFRFDGSFHFGLGENLGHDYTLIGSDGIELSGGAEGGSTYHVQADGSELRRVSTGWWNPFGMCVDNFDRVFGTDNDPGASPPCRLIQVLEDGDYGYQYRYGRTGLHALVSWTGDAPGILPMIAGTAEAPCAVISYDSDGLPEDYRGDLIVASWSDHRIERFVLRQENDSVLVKTQGEDIAFADDGFRPVGLAIAPDGSIFVSDWVSSSYQLHKLGRVWRIRAAAGVALPTSGVQTTGLLSKVRTEREAAARRLLHDEAGLTQIREAAQHADAGVRATALLALANAEDTKTNWKDIAEHDPVTAIRQIALREVIRRGEDVRDYLTPGKMPNAVRYEALRSIEPDDRICRFLSDSISSDPAILHAVVSSIARNPGDRRIPLIMRQHRVAGLLGLQRSGALSDLERDDAIREFLQSDDSDAVRVALRWVADDRVESLRSDVESVLNRDLSDFEVFRMVFAVLDVLDGVEPRDTPSPEQLLPIVTDAARPLELRSLALRVTDPNSELLTDELLTTLLTSEHISLRREAIRKAAEKKSPSLLSGVAAIAVDVELPIGLRLEAIAALAGVADQHRDTLLELADAEKDRIRREALRALVGLELTDEERGQLEHIRESHDRLGAMIDRLLGEEFDVPSADNIDAWLVRLNSIEGGGNVAAGERVFFHSKVATCGRCHVNDGRGVAVGPSLTLMSRRLALQNDADRWLLETILQPSKDMAPQYTPWLIVTTDGKTLTGLPRRKGGGSEAYLGLDGKEFSVSKSNIEFHQESDTSIMPQDLLKNLTRRELADLFAFLKRSAD